MIKKYFEFFERDKDISVYEEFHYIWITLGETFRILLNIDKKPLKNGE